MSSAKRFVVVVNPRGGTRRGMAVLESVKPVFVAAGAELDVRVTTHAGHAKEIARTVNLEAYDGFCVVGGDGTIHEAVGGLMQQDDPSSTPLGVIPGGTGNSVLQHLECVEPLEAARRIVAGDVKPLDVMRVSTANEVTYCVNIVGWGAIADINVTAERLRALGTPRYTVAALSHVLRAKRHHAKLVLDDKTIEGDFVFVIACNTKFTGKGMQLAPHADISDGKIDVVVAHHASRWQVLKMLNKIYNGSHISLPCVEYHQVRSFGITSESRDLLNLDGEMKCATPVSTEIMPGALRVFV
jgi:diacylglycerol kinase (ATP)